MRDDDRLAPFAHGAHCHPHASRAGHDAGGTGNDGQHVGHAAGSYVSAGPDEDGYVPSAAAAGISIKPWHGH
jgi:hypothetical protein